MKFYLLLLLSINILASFEVKDYRSKFVLGLDPSSFSLPKNSSDTLTSINIDLSLFLAGDEISPWSEDAFYTSLPSSNISSDFIPNVSLQSPLYDGLIEAFYNRVVHLERTMEVSLAKWMPQNSIGSGVGSLESFLNYNLHWDYFGLAYHLQFSSKANVSVLLKRHRVSASVGQNYQGDLYYGLEGDTTFIGEYKGDNFQGRRHYEVNGSKWIPEVFLRWGRLHTGISLGGEIEVKGTYQKDERLPFFVDPLLLSVVEIKDEKDSAYIDALAGDSVLNIQKNGDLSITLQVPQIFYSQLELISSMLYMQYLYLIKPLKFSEGEDYAKYVKFESQANHFIGLDFRSLNFNIKGGGWSSHKSSKMERSFRQVSLPVTGWHRNVIPYASISYLYESDLKTLFEWGILPYAYFKVGVKYEF